MTIHNYYCPELPQALNLKQFGLRHAFLVVEKFWKAWASPTEEEGTGAPRRVMDQPPSIACWRLSRLQPSGCPLLQNPNTGSSSNGMDAFISSAFFLACRDSSVVVPYPSQDHHTVTFQKLHKQYLGPKCLGNPVKTHHQHLGSPPPKFYAQKAPGSSMVHT